MLDECGLERVQVIRVGREILHGPHGRPIRLHCEDRARLHGASIEMDRARAALRGIATDLRTGQVQVVADDVDEQPSRLDIERDGPTVDGEPDRDLGRGWSRRVERAQAGTPTAATSSSALPMPSTMRSIWSSVITNGGEMWIACARRTRLATP